MSPEDKPTDKAPKEEGEAKPAAAEKPAAKSSAAEKPASAKKPAAKKASEEEGAAVVERPARARKAPTPSAKDAAAKKSAAKDNSVEKPAAKKATAGKAAAKKEEPVAEKAREAKTEKVAAAKAEKAAKPASAPRRDGQAVSPARRKVVRAQARYVRTSARKARMVCGHLCGKSVPEARAILAFTPREVARDWSKLLESAVANAENNHELIEDDLLVREAYADEGPTIKRFRPRAQGRAAPIRKRTSHLTITLTPKP
jgi:ribosomal protein L22